MIHKPQFRTCFRVEQLATEGVLVLSETDYRVLEGHVERLAPLLTGEHTADEIVDRLQGDIPAAELYYTLLQLEKSGYLVEGGQALPAREAAYWEGLALDTRQVAGRLRDARVSVTALGEMAAGPLIEALAALHVQTGTDGELAVVITDDYLHEALAAFNRDAVERGRPYLLVKPVGAIVWIGPLVVPGRTGCWACLAQRLQINRPAETFLRTRNGAGGSFVFPAGLPSTVQTAMQMAATEAAKWIVQGKNDTLEGTLVTFDTRTLETQAHVLTRRPQCPCCGGQPPARQQTPRPLALTSRAKRFIDDGGHRSVPPEVTLQTYRHHLSPLTGIVRQLKRLSGQDDPLIHSYAANHNITSRFEGVGTIRKNLYNISGGKGKTDRQARASGLCEAMERYSGIYHGDEITRVSSYRALGQKAIHPNACMGFSEQQYRNRDALNAETITLAQWVPAPFDEAQEIEWTPAWSLTQQTFKVLPTAYCYYGYPPGKSTFCRADSNGNAAGNTLEEAILQGFMEVVERDSVALWWYNRLAMPGVDLDSFTEPYFEKLRAYYQSIGRALWVLDVTADLEIPAFVALSRCTDQARDEILFGFGAHFDPRIGILRALTEMNQILPTALQMEQENRGRPIHPDKPDLHWWQHAALENQPYLVPRPDLPAKVAADYLYHRQDDLLDDIKTAAEIVERKGMELLVLDQTRPDIGLPVVKVIVPGLRHYWPRFGPGRLYDVPVQQGWLSEPLKESQLNPSPIII